MYEFVEVPWNPTAAAAVFNAQEGYHFVGWHVPPSGGNSGWAIFEQDPV